MEKLLSEVFELEYADGKLGNYEEWNKNFNPDFLLTASLQFSCKKGNHQNQNQIDTLI